MFCIERSLLDRSSRRFACRLSTRSAASRLTGRSGVSSASWANNMKIRGTKGLWVSAVAAATSSAWAGGVPTTVLEEVVVTGRLDQLHGAPLSASQGVVGGEQIEMRPVL